MKENKTMYKKVIDSPTKKGDAYIEKWGKEILEHWRKIGSLDGRKSWGRKSSFRVIMRRFRRNDTKKFYILIVRSVVSLNGFKIQHSIPTIFSHLEPNSQSFKPDKPIRFDSFCFGRVVLVGFDQIRVFCTALPKSFMLYFSFEMIEIE